MRVISAPSVCALFCAFTATAGAQAPGPVIDSGVISGLGARNIGSAAMSGRIAALAGYNDAGSYEVRDATAVITGKLGTGYWKRSLQ